MRILELQAGKVIGGRKQSLMGRSGEKQTGEGNTKSRGLAHEISQNMDSIRNLARSSSHYILKGNLATFYLHP